MRRLVPTGENDLSIFQDQELKNTHCFDATSFVIRDVDRFLNPGGGTVLRFGVKVAVVRYLNFLKIAKNGFNMQFYFILNVFCQKIDKLFQVSNFTLDP